MRSGMYSTPQSRLPSPTVDMVTMSGSFTTPLSMNSGSAVTSSSMGKPGAVSSSWNTISKNGHGLNPKRGVFPEGSNEKILRACHVLLEEQIAIPVLLGHGGEVQKAAAESGISLESAVIVEPAGK